MEVRWVLPLVMWMVACAATAQEVLPPRSAWRATSSAEEVPALAPRHAIDLDDTTKWGGPFSPGHWLQVDLSRPVELGGVVLHWDLAFAVAYRIQVSLDGEQWREVYETNDNAGMTDYVFFPPTRARYLRVASAPRTADWGVNIFELEPIPASAAPQIAGLASRADPVGVWRPGSSFELLAHADAGDVRELRIAFAKPRTLAGVEVYWGAERSSARLEGRDVNGRWQTLAVDPEGFGDTSFLAAREARDVQELRIRVEPQAGIVPQIQRLRLLGPARVMTPLKRYEIAASRAYRHLFPTSLQQQQVYWTVVGIPAGRQKSIFDEYGHIEPFKGGPLVQAIWRNQSGHTVAAGNVPRVHRLRAGWMPMPSVDWSPQAGLVIRSESFAIEQSGQPVTLVRHRLENVGPSRIDGELALIVRPMQINPPWQNGGPSPIRDIAIEGAATKTSVRVNGRTLLHSLSPVDARAASGFGDHAETEMTRLVALRSLPATLSASDRDGLAAAALLYRASLAPGATRDVVIALPLGTQRIDTGGEPSSDVAFDRGAVMGDSADEGVAFERWSARVARDWNARFGQIGFALPDASLVNMLRAQAAYMLLNQTGHAMQPGPRNYSRSFIRDGSASAAILARMGQPQVARDYLRWYAEHAVQPSGLVSPILNDDGSVYRGFGSDIEYDSQGQFIYLVAEIARLDGGAETVREYREPVIRAMRFMQHLRERTLVPGYRSDRPAPERFRGIIAPSISHEGYSTPTHSYWDDYWALKGWQDAAWLAVSWGDRATAAWAREQYAALRESMAQSIRTTMAWRNADYIPTDADLGNPDPTSVSIALDPTGQKDLLPRAALERTFERYLEQVRGRDAPEALYSYTPYELRNVLTYVHLNQPQHAVELLDTFLRHRRPHAWQVFAEVVQSRERHPIYLGDMPHTWIGAEYARALIGMLMREEGETLMLLPGAPSKWLEGKGLAVTELPTAFGKLTIAARYEGATLQFEMGAGLRPETAVQLSWPQRSRPSEVIVDGRAVTTFDGNGVTLSAPFRTLTARWSP